MTEDPSSELLQFYQARGASCASNEQGIICVGRAFPFGEYHVYISEMADESTTLGIDVQWKGCSSEVN